ncbi:hypothetical protein [Burkholderia multivorans]|uniref:hypothetical protein n=1 Tax=Burkholderia multivorans TaxID=87883 RepID=UPI0021C23669|nr:hypothetical protein [Burkholderia multivorans]
MELELQEIRKSMHETRYVIMQHYLFMYGNRLKGRECRAELFEGERLSLEELEDFMNTVMELEQEEQKLTELRKQYHDAIMRGLESQRKRA